MSKVENLKLREIKVLNEKDLMSLYSDYGSGSGSGSGSGPIFEDECQGSGDCGTYGVCESTGTWPFNKNRCRDMSSRERACV